MRYSYDPENKGIVAYPDNADEWLSLIQDIAFDSDGYEQVQNLKELIEEMRQMAHMAQDCLKDKKYFKNEITERKSLKIAKQLEEREAANGQT